MTATEAQIHAEWRERVMRHRRTEGGDRFSHQTVAVLEAFATSVLGLERALHYAIDPHVVDETYWDNQAAMWARGAVRCARLLTVKEDYR